jgi:hypothetical protein
MRRAPSPFRSFGRSPSDRPATPPAPPLGRRTFLEGVAWALATATCAAPADSEPRTQVLYVVIDRPSDARAESHAPNLAGLRAAAAAFDPSTRVTPVTLADLADLDVDTLDATYEPLAIFGAGSFTEWVQYGLDARWRRDLDHWMSIIREMTIPMLAVCGSHELVGAAFNGFGAIAHMCNSGAPVPIADELAQAPPRLLGPRPCVGEAGTYPIVRTRDGAVDPITREALAAPMVASHHTDMVIDTTGFTVLYAGDGSRPPATQARAPDRALLPCHVQATKRDDPQRLLYTTQFHPEISAFLESTADDGGFGTAYLHAFLAGARDWWSQR